MRLFFFGTLMDMDLLALVLGTDPATSLTLRRGRLPGVERRRAAGEDYPVLIDRPDAAVDGLVVDGLSPVQVQRIQFFEGGEYGLETRPVVSERDGVAVDSPAAVFIASDLLPASDEPWSLAAWQASRKPHALITAELMMAQFGRISLEEMDDRWDAVKAEADRLLAARTAVA